MTACGAWGGGGGTRLGGCEKKARAFFFVLGVLAGEAHDGETGRRKGGIGHAKIVLDYSQPRDQQRRGRRKKKQHAYTRTSAYWKLP